MTNQFDEIFGRFWHCTSSQFLHMHNVIFALYRVKKTYFRWISHVISIVVIKMLWFHVYKCCIVFICNVICGNVKDLIQCFLHVTLQLAIKNRCTDNNYSMQIDRIFCFPIFIDNNTHSKLRFIDIEMVMDQCSVLSLQQ